MNSEYERQIYWIWLTLKSALNPIMLDRLLEVYHTPENIYNQTDFSECGFLSKRGVEQLSDKSLDEAKMTEDKVEKMGGYILTYDDEEYPPLLKKIYSPPYVLYLMGQRLKWDELLTITVVGTRKYSSYGKKVTETITKELSSMGATVVSGMARGIDSIAGCAAIRAGGKTIAVLGSGIDVIYPTEHKSLYNAIMKNGVVMTEFPPGTKPYKQNFPRRNRIMAGLSYGVLVSQAPRRSGALITAAHAIENNRDVFAVGGSIFDEEQAGANILIQMGAKSVMTAKDILDEFPYIKVEPLEQECNIVTERMVRDKMSEIDLEKLDDVQKKIVKLLVNGALYSDEIIEHLDMAAGAVNPAVIMLEISGIIKKNSDNKYELA